MKEHIYLNTSNMASYEIIRNDSRFEPVNEYPIYESLNLHHNEVGRLKSMDNYYHIMLGSIPQNLCPWCGGPPLFTKVSENKNFSTYAMVCYQCGSRGAEINVHSSAMMDEKQMAEIRNISEAKYRHRLPWDYNLQVGNNGR